jgi:aspartate kinase
VSGALVLKFGGTSLGTPRRRRSAALRVRAHLRRGAAPVVVVSAAGGATDIIIGRLAGLARGEVHEVASRETDRALATGEDLSAALFAFALAEIGVPAWSLRGGEAGISADGPFGAGRILGVDPGPVQRLLRQGVVPVISGFQASRPDGETVTLGRGGSDTSAVAIAAALGPADCHIITDVDAVYDRDPAESPDAVPFARLSHCELVDLTRVGATVIHPDAAELALARRVPLRVYHFRDRLAGGAGTRIGVERRGTPGRGQYAGERWAAEAQP